MNTYDFEQAFTDRYGDALMGVIAASFGCKNFERVTDKATQVQGVDYWIWKEGPRSIKQAFDLKIDLYDNENFAFEEYQQYTGIGEQSWVHHDKDIWVAYFKVARRQVWIYKTEDLQKFMETDVYKKRKSFKTNRVVNGKAGAFKNFRFDELPVHHIVNVEMFYNPFENDSLMETKKSLLDAVLYRDE